MNLYSLLITIFKSYKIFPKVIIYFDIPKVIIKRVSLSLMKTIYWRVKIKFIGIKKQNKSLDIYFFCHWNARLTFTVMLVRKLYVVKFEIFLTISFILKLFHILCFAKELGSINSAFVSIQTLTHPLNILRELC